MPANEFERRVQGQLDDFQLNPSASVWKNVEEQIRKKKKRRIIFFFLLPLAAGLCFLSTYYLLNTSTARNNQQVSIDPKHPATQSENKSSVNETTGTMDQQHLANEQPATAPTKNQTQTNSTRSSANNNTEVVIRGINIEKRSPKASGAKRMTQKRSQPANQSIEANKDDREINEVIASVVPARDNKIDNTTITTQTQLSPIQQLNTEPNTAQVNDESISKDTIEVNKSTNPGEAKKKPASSSKIKWGIEFFAGASSNTDKALALFSASRAAFDNLAANPGSSVGSGTSSGNPSIIPPSEVHVGPAFNLGVTVEFELSKRSRISSGIQYSYASNRIKTGAKRDTSLLLSPGSAYTANVSLVYRGAQQNDYTNRYHFISMPVTYHLQLNKGKKLPLQWDAGMSLSYLIATNALVYSSSAGGIYYSDKERFNKLHFALATGFSLRFKTGGVEWVTGPQIGFDLMPVMKNDKSQYLLYTGLRTQLFFSNKKR
jgi:hypothetical protein